MRDAIRGSRGLGRGASYRRTSISKTIAVNFVVGKSGEKVSVPESGRDLGKGGNGSR